MVAGIGFEQPNSEEIETNLPQLLKEESKLCSNKELTEEIIEMVDANNEQTHKMKPQPKSNSNK